MKKLIFSILIFSVFLNVYAENKDKNPFKMVGNYVPGNLDTIKLKGKSGYILFAEKINSFRFGNPGAKGNVYGKMLEVNITNNESNNLMVCCSNDLNYLVVINPNGNEKLKEMNSGAFKNRCSSEVQAQQNYLVNNDQYFNAKVADQKIQEVLSENTISNIGRIENDLGLFLTNYDSDYQLQYFKFVIRNQSKEAFQFDIVESYYEDKKTLIDLYPVAQSYFSTVEGKSEFAFCLAFKKDLNHDFHIKLKDINSEKSINILIPLSQIKN